jgi:hypothetical protein
MEENVKGGALPDRAPFAQGLDAAQARSVTFRSLKR